MNVMTSTWMIVASAIVGAMHTPSVLSHTQLTRRPHIVIALADDIGWNNVGWHAKTNAARPEILTPRLDKLLAEGIELDRHIAFKYCSPSRCALYSGRNPIHVNVDNEVFASNTGIPDNMTCIATKLRQVGYRTVFAGKWHSGMRSYAQTPRGRGFDAALSYFNPDNDYWSQVYSGCPLVGPKAGTTPIVDLWEAIEGGSEGPALTRTNSCPYEGRFIPMNGCIDILAKNCATEWEAVDTFGSNNGCKQCASEAGGPSCTNPMIERWCQGFRNYTTGAGCHPIHSTAVSPRFEDEFLAQYAVGRIQNHSPEKGPLFLVFASHAAHVPLQSRLSTLSRFDFMRQRNDKPEHARQVYAAIISEADTAIGSIVDALEAKHMWNNTLFLYVPDNGGPSYLNGTSGANNFPLTGGKMSNYEGGIRVASFLSGGWLPLNRRGSTYDGLVAIWDWYAILGTIGGVPNVTSDEHAAQSGLPGVDAIDLSSAIIEGCNPLNTTCTRRQELAIGTNDRSMRLVSGAFLDQTKHEERSLYKLLVGLQNQAAHSAPLSPNGTMNSSLGFPSGAEPSSWSPDSNAYDCGDRGCLFEVLSDPTESFNLADTEPSIVDEMQAMLKRFRATSLIKVIGNVDEAACDAAEKRGFAWGPWA